MPSSVVPVEHNSVQVLKNRLPESLRINAMTLGGRIPAVHRFLALHLGGRSDGLVMKGTDICIEAPPGSGNSFMVQAFSMANPTCNIAHHHHVPAQVRRAVRQRIPTLVILRDPIACTLARVPSLSHLSMIGPNLRMWLAFWTSVRPLISRIAVITFDQLTAEPPSAITLINDFYDTEFNSRIPPSAEVFATMHEYRDNQELPQDKDPLHPNVPDPAKGSRKRAIEPHVFSHRLASQARGLYLELVNNVGRTKTAPLHD